MTDSIKTRAEQLYARGLLPEEIALKLHIRLRDAIRHGEAMDAAAHHVDSGFDPPLGRRIHCKRGHDLSGDNVVGRRRECRQCKRDRERKAA